jgi:hypothetical protein
MPFPVQWWIQYRTTFLRRRIELQAVLLLDVAQVPWCWLMLDDVVVV